MCFSVHFLIFFKFDFFLLFVAVAIDLIVHHIWDILHGNNENGTKFIANNLIE